jgi:cellulose synthase/poly-beta-1,6-N-acetylglucosamine synthase-like glycosyltransferase
VTALESTLLAVNLLTIVYFAALNFIYTVLMVLGLRTITTYVRRRPLMDIETISESELTTPISIVIPAYDEGPVIVDSVRAMLDSGYPQLEVLVVNDGSCDDTLERLRDAYALVEVERVPRCALATAPVRAVYACPFDDRLLVIDKGNGGKADAINAGLRFARYPLFCTMDADTIVDEDAFARLVRPFQAHPETVACGGIVRIANGCSVRGSRVEDVRAPRAFLANVQIMEYLRAFLCGRTGWSRLGALLVISGAFGLFRRDVVVEAGGYDTTTVGEDAEIVVRLHRYCREHGRPYRVVFLADPVCWTEAPADFRSLCRQRNRWHRGLIETLWRHRSMLLRPRYGVVGLVALPYFLLFEALGPIVEIVGTVSVIVALGFGRLDPRVALLFFALALSYGLVLSFGALLAEEHAFRRYRRWRCLARLAGAAVFENFGYRQILSLVRVWSLVTLARSRGRRDWGAMSRAGFVSDRP